MSGTGVTCCDLSLSSRPPGWGMSSGVHQSSGDSQDSATGVWRDGSDCEAWGGAGHQGTGVHGTVQGTGGGGGGGAFGAVQVIKELGFMGLYKVGGGGLWVIKELGFMGLYKVGGGSLWVIKELGFMGLYKVGGGGPLGHQGTGVHGTVQGRGGGVFGSSRNWGSWDCTR